MHHSVEDSNKVSALIANQVEEFLSRGGEIEVVPVGVSKDLESFRSINTINYNGRSLNDEELEKIKAKENAKAVKWVEMGREIYELRQGMTTKEICKKLGISISSYSRRMEAYRNHCKFHGIKYEIPNTRPRTKSEDVKKLYKEIGEKYESGVSKDDLAKQYGFCRGHINKILHLMGATKEQCFKARNEEILRLRKEGLKLKEIAKMFNISPNRVCSIIKGA